MTWRSSGSSRGGFSPYQNIVPLPVLGRTNVPSSFDFAIDVMTNHFIVRDHFGRVKYKVPMNHGQRYYPVNNSVIKVRARGHIAVVSRGNEIVAIDLLRGTRSGQHAILWREEVFSQQVAPNRGVFNSIQAKATIDPWGQRRYTNASDKQQNLIGQISALDQDTVVYQHNRELICADLLTGKPVWRRNNVTPGSDLTSDQNRLYVFAPGGKKLEIFDLSDGRKLGDRDLPTTEKKWLTHGNLCLLYRNTGSNLELIARQLEDGKQLWKRSISTSSRGTQINERQLAYLQPDGKFHLLDWLTGKDIITTKIPKPRGVSNIYVLPSKDHYFLMTHYVSRRAKANVSAPSVGSHCVEVSGDVFALDRKTGKQTWSAPASLKGFGITLDQPRNVPLLTFVRQSYIRNGRTSTQKIGYMCLDKRDGRLLVPQGELSGYLRDVQVTGQPENQRANIRLGNRSLQINFTTDPTPPAAPYQVADESQVAVGLGKKLGNFLKGLGQQKPAEVKKDKAKKDEAPEEAK